MPFPPFWWHRLFKLDICPISYYNINHVRFFAEKGRMNLRLSFCEGYALRTRMRSEQPMKINQLEKTL